MMTSRAVARKLARACTSAWGRDACAVHTARRSFFPTRPAKGDAGGGHDPSLPKPEGWWPDRPEIAEDAPEVKFNLILPSGQSTVELVGRAGESLEEVAKREGYMEGACDGNCQCSTCHVFVPGAADKARLGMPTRIDDFEIDMLELAAEYESDPDGSRLACQITLAPGLEGLTVKLPGRTTNYMDHVPFD
ncbi:hypothetical protein M885DRAFT_528120 [Pelagophyceae sp. CCMP2097]|nr:hypothetical protein M885DRAFT_528120 [Pelagophyceae sp. CCMP2097]